jgi:hypothetical protein
MNPNEKMPISCHKFICEICNFNCSKRSNYDKHLLTLKHKNLINPNIKNSGNNFECDNCKKIYKHASTLSAHKKKCITPINVEYKEASSEEMDSKLKSLSFLVVDLIKSNHDLHKQMMEVCQKIQPVTNNINSHNNSNNKTFNLQFFLNEQCKDAMNIMDFVNTFKLDFSDLERIGEVGYVEGISNIVIDKLNEMDIYKRPIHCSDAKREIMYVKDKDVWEKENANNDKIRLALKHITKKNTDLIRPWAIAHPGVLNSDHRLSDKYQEMIIEAMGGNKKNKNMKEGEDKIIKKISKMVLIDKCNGYKNM